MKKLFWLVYFLALIIPLYFVFQSFFRPGPLAFGDAPFFYDQGLKELLSEPMAWTNRGINFGGVNLLIWISPLTILYGVLGSILKLGNDLTIRAIFYFPALIFSVIGTYSLSKYLKLSDRAGFFTTLIYVLNTYFILLIDGGQVGVSLAYGLFPLSVLFLKKAVDAPSFNKYVLGLIFFVICSTADPRIAIISFLTVILWQTVEYIIRKQLKLFRNFRVLVLIAVSWIGLSSYWIIPLIKNQSIDNLLTNSSSQGVKLINAILLFSLHWPANIFGQTNSPFLYFFILPIIIFIPFISMIFKKDNKSSSFLTFIICYIIFCLLTVSSPLIAKIPFGFAFRDTSKFFIPLVLFAGLLIGKAVEVVDRKIFSVLVYLYLVFLVWPALFGKMNFVLSDRGQNEDIQKIYEKLSADNSFYRTLWIPERHPLAYDVINNPAMDGQSLVKSIPFALNNAGEDPFNFLNSPNYIDWLRILGVKYLILSDDQRNLTKSTDQVNNWQSIISLISGTTDIEKQNWETVVPVFKIENSFPRFFAVNKVYGVVGKPLADPNIPTLNYEDGLFDPNTMRDVSEDGYSIVLNGGNKDDLQMSFLQKYFQSPSESEKSEWAVYTHDSYLKYKYELLIRGIKFEDLDYSRGIAFSTVSGEKISFKFSVKDPGDYIFAYRSMIPENKESSLVWHFENINLNKGDQIKTLENKNNLEILNVVALVPKKEFDDSKIIAENLFQNFGISLSEIKKEKLVYQNVNVDNWATLRYKLENPGKNYWIFFSDNFNSGWRLKVNHGYYSSYPAYSMINAFYIDPRWNNLEIQFKGQENVRWGEYFTIVSGLGITIVYLFLKGKKWKD